MYKPLCPKAVMVWPLWPTMHFFRLLGSYLRKYPTNRSQPGYSVKVAIVSYNFSLYNNLIWAELVELCTAEAVDKTFNHHSNIQWRCGPETHLPVPIFTEGHYHWFDSMGGSSKGISTLSSYLPANVNHGYIQGRAKIHVLLLPPSVSQCPIGAYGHISFSQLLHAIWMIWHSSHPKGTISNS